jgi:hypothetical protein
VLVAQHCKIKTRRWMLIKEEEEIEHKGLGIKQLSRNTKVN